ncbi:hypothetical protein [Thalassolituus sp.]|uniref:hypothetical protein n=1 Tax=Thalassolituus sp. TaxID=2030822 RepID=UPI002624C031|nr:hypothetical protein [Thalassolituus sp.]
MPAPQPVTVNGILYQSRLAACRAFGHSGSKIDHRMAAGMSLEEALTSKDRYRNVKKHPLYGHWNAMNTRCHSASESSLRYQGRVAVCERWRNDFFAFVEDMGLPPSANHSIDRIDNDKGYSPENCRWATRLQQQRNMRSNTWIEAFGKRMILKDWEIASGLLSSTIMNRLKKGWSAEDALTKNSRCYVANSQAVILEKCSALLEKY